MNIKKPLKDFFSSKFNVGLVILLILVGAFAFFNVSDPNKIDPADPNYDPEKVAVNFFFTPTCPYCSQQKPIIEQIKQERDDIQIFDNDASTQKGSALFYKLSAEAGLDTSRMGVPTIFVGEKALVGLQSKENIIDAIDECLNNCKDERYQTEEKHSIDTAFTEFDRPFIGRMDLTSISLPVLAVLLGLIDGFNPCALWVLVFIVTLLLGENDKKKIWLVVGSFVLASAISYFIFMTAWLNLFLIIGYIRIITLIIGLFAIGAGVSHLKEYFTSKGAMTCNVGDEESHEKTMDRIKNIISQPLTIGILISIIGLAFAVNAIEFVCSAAIPAIYTQMLALSGLSTIKYYMYILLYVFFYMIDHIIIFGMAAFALGLGTGEKYAKYCKLIGGAILAGLGMLMVFAPHLLR